MPSFEIEGKLTRKYDAENKSASFQTREFVIEVPDGNFPNFVKFQLTQDRCSLIDKYNEGNEIKVHFDLRGREWQGKYFTNLNAWRLEAATGAEPAAAAKAAPKNDSVGDFPTATDEPPMAANEDLPF